MIWSSNKRVNFILGRVSIQSDFPMQQVASLVATRLVPEGRDLEWKVLDGHETPVLGLGGILGGELELQKIGPMEYTLSYDTNPRFMDDQARILGIEVDYDDFLVVTPLLLWALGEIQGLRITPGIFS